MFLKSIRSEGYRNLSSEPLELSEGVNLLYGKNAAGKTNTLECAYLFASGRSFRTRHEAELICRGAHFARAEIRLLREKAATTEETMAMVWQTESVRSFSKKMLYQGYEVSKASEFLGIFRAVLFTPDHLSLIKGSPEERRRFMDIALSQLAPRYVRCMNDYLRILASKNAYLRKAAAIGKADFDYLEVLNGQLAATAAVLVRQRSLFAERLKTFAGSLYAALSGSRETLDVRYVSATKTNFSDASYTESKLCEIYRADRESELRMGRTLHGPHKDDLLIFIAGAESSDVAVARSLDENAAENAQNESSVLSEFAARTFGSQGQQRSAVLAIKLAEGEIFKELTGEYPVFLLDDLLGELDAERRSVLTSLIRDKQTVITCCDRSFLPDIKHVTAFHVANGHYERQTPPFPKGASI